MSVPHPTEHKHEIIIVRRGGQGEDEDHHGGVWKIAFADFMTAMMCFFLVMWLINAANEQTKAAVASYFNPIKLVDRNSSRKGLDEIGEGPIKPHESAETSLGPAKEPAPAEPKATVSAESAGTAKGGSDDKRSDVDLFQNPYAVLAEIASESGNLQNISSKGDGGVQISGPATGASGGESFRDPFAPDFWSQEMATTPPPPISAEAAATRETEPAEAEIADVPPLATALAEKPAEAAAEAIAGKPGVAQGAETKAADPKPAELPARGARDAETADNPTGQSPSAPDARTSGEAEEISRELQTAFGAKDDIFKGMSVSATADGVMISVTDQLEFGMFEVGSAVPRRDLVLAMEKIARILETRKGAVTIRGHTDARPFSGKTYDNWRLSTARAHSAYYMLTRAGLDERRITEVSGFADRKLKLADQPFADANRRIEILLEAGG